MSQPLHAWVKRTITSKPTETEKATITKIEASGFEIKGFVHYIEKSAYDELQNDMSVMYVRKCKQLDSMEGQLKLKQDDWIDVCKELDEARKENEELMREDYWESRCKIEKSKGDELEEALDWVEKYNGETVLGQQALKKHRSKNGATIRGHNKDDSKRPETTGSDSNGPIT